MKELFDKVSLASSKLTTHTYSTSFSLGIFFLNRKFHNPIYSIYAFVRFADEIVDSFHGYDKADLLTEFRKETYLAIERKISLNPVINSFQAVVTKYSIEKELIDSFLNSMEMDLSQNFHSENSYQRYILGSAEVVGLMCLRVFVEGNNELYEYLKPYAMKLGSAFQKVNFLRDFKSDSEFLGRVYFPQLDFVGFTEADKRNIETDIENDFREAIIGIKKLPASARFGVYVAFVYYKSLFNKIKSLSSNTIKTERIRISNTHKLSLLATSFFKYSFRIL